MKIKASALYDIEFRESDVSPGRTEVKQGKGSLTVWALYAYFSDSQNAVFELLVWCM